MPLSNTPVYKARFIVCLFFFGVSSHVVPWRSNKCCVSFLILGTRLPTAHCLRLFFFSFLLCILGSALALVLPSASWVLVSMRQFCGRHLVFPDSIQTIACPLPFFRFLVWSWSAQHFTSFSRLPCSLSAMAFQSCGFLLDIHCRKFSFLCIYVSLRKLLDC